MPQDGPEHQLQRKDAALLAMLALHGPTPRSRLAGLLWPDASGTGAGNNLRQRLFRMRRAVGREVVVHAPTLAFAPAVTHDLQVVADSLRSDPQAARGDLLGPFDYAADGPLADWVSTARRHWRDSIRDTLVAIALDLERRGQLAEALPYALRLVQHDPSFEPASQLLMRLHLHGGDRAAGLAEFERCVRALREHLGRTPSDDTLALARLVGRSAPASYTAPTPLAAALRRPPRTVGREAAFDAAERRWHADGVVLLSGPAGIGKTRVFDELAQRWGIGVTLRAAADDAEHAHGLLARLLGAVLPFLDHGNVEGNADGTLNVNVDGNASGLAEADAAWLRWIAGLPGQMRPPGQILPARLASVLRRALALAAAGGLAAMAIDDLQYADGASLSALCAVLPGPSNASSFSSPPQQAGPRWLLASRDPSLPDELRSWLAGLEEHIDPVVPLAPLERRHIAELLASVSTSQLDVAAWAERIDRHCGGHPLFVLQVLRELHHSHPHLHLHPHAQLPTQPPPELPLPAETLTLVARRLDRADAATQQLACVAALCGVDFNAALAARLLRCSAAELLAPWRRLEALNILHGASFSHDLVRQAVLDGVPAGVRPLVHLQIAEALRDDASATARRARHWEAGAAFAEAARDCVAVAGEVLARGLQTQGLEWLRRAAADHRQAGNVEDASVCDWRAGHLVLASSSAADAEAAAHELLAAAAAPLQRARALELLSRARAERHDASALGDAESAHAIAVECADAALVALTRLCLANAWILIGRNQQAFDALQVLEPQLALLDSQTQVKWAELRCVVLAHLGRRREALAANRQALDAATLRGDLAAMADFTANIADQLGYLGQIEEASRTLEQAIALGHRAGIERGYVLVNEMSLAGNHADLGRFETALPMFERVAAELRKGGYVGWVFNVENDWAVTYLRLGRFDLAQQLLTEPDPGTPTWARAARRLVQGRLQQWRGGSALAAVQEAVRLLRAGGSTQQPFVRERIELELAHCTAPDVALRRSAVALRWARRNEHVALGWRAAWVRTDALLQLGRTAQAARCAGELMAQFEEGGWRAFGFYLPELWLSLCDALAAGGRTDAAVALAAHGVRWINERAAHDVPALFRDSFLQRNPFNRRLLHWRAP